MHRIWATNLTTGVAYPSQYSIDDDKSMGWLEAKARAMQIRLNKRADKDLGPRYSVVIKENDALYHVYDEIGLWRGCYTEVEATNLLSLNTEWTFVKIKMGKVKPQHVVKE